MAMGYEMKFVMSDRQLLIRRVRPERTKRPLLSVAIIDGYL